MTRRTISRAGTCWALGREVKAVQSISATSASLIHCPDASSNRALVYLMHV